MDGASRPGASHHEEPVAVVSILYRGATPIQPYRWSRPHACDEKNSHDLANMGKWQACRSGRPTLGYQTAREFVNGEVHFNRIVGTRTVQTTIRGLAPHSAQNRSANQSTSSIQTREKGDGCQVSGVVGDGGVAASCRARSVHRVVLILFRLQLQGKT